MTEPYEISDLLLLTRAVRNARDESKNKGVGHPRWVAVMDLFNIGSTYARLICNRVGYDPDEIVKR
jgi:hypothetical protein